MRLRICAGSPEPALIAYAISTRISCVGLFQSVRLIPRSGLDENSQFPFSFFKYNLGRFLVSNNESLKHMIL